MSRFLGPIHFWLHGKIRLHDQMEKHFEEQFFSQSGKVADAIYSGFNSTYGNPLPDEDLESNIQTDNIHGWLQERITRSETRFAAKLTYLTKLYGTEAMAVAAAVYREFGERCGEEAQMTEGFGGQPDLAYKLANNYVLEGMPCDQAGSVTEQSDTHLSWQSIRCLHRGYWEAIGGDPAAHYILRDAFNKAFFSRLAGYRYNRAEQEGIMHYTIEK